MRFVLALVGVLPGLGIGVLWGQTHSTQTFAPHEQDGKSAPSAIRWEPPRLPTHPIEFESAEERHLRLVVVTQELQQPWAMAFLPDGSILVTERPGRIRIVRHGVLDPHPVTGVPAVSTTGARGLQGLMDIALHPRFAENHWIYFVYHKPVGQDSGATTLARAVWNGHALDDVRDIFETDATDTEASRIAFGRDGMLYMTISGPGGGAHVDRAQDPHDYAGKTVRLRDDGTVPADGPFARRMGYRPAIYTLGHRNGSGLAVNPQTGDLWEAEQGPNGGDELNILSAGKNYGWPLVSYGRDYTGSRISPRPVLEGVEDPAVVWLPSIGLTGMTFYTGDRFPHWKNNLFVTGLRQGGIPRTGQIQRVVFSDRWEELRREPMLNDLGQRVRISGKAPTDCSTC